MEINELIPDNKIALVDADKYRAQKLMAELNAEQIDNEAHKRFLDYVKNSGVDICFSINGAGKIVRQQAVFEEIGYHSQGFDISLPQELKYAIASEALRYLNEQVEDHAKECKALVKKECRHWRTKVCMWKYTAGIIGLFALVELILLCL